MRKTICMLAVALMLVASACSGDSSDTTAAAPSTTATTSAPATTATTSAPMTTEAPTTTTAASAGASGCVDCHTDEEALRALATEPPETEVLSEGEG